MHPGINHISVVGVPIFNFVPIVLPLASQASKYLWKPHDDFHDDTFRVSVDADFCNNRCAAALADPPRPVVLRFETRDPLVQAGGLDKITERGFRNEEEYWRNALNVSRQAMHLGWQHDPFFNFARGWTPDGMYDWECVQTSDY